MGRVSAPDKFSFTAAAAVHVWLADLTADDASVAACLASLDPAELVRARRFHFERDRRRFTLARGTLRRLLGHYLGLAPAEVRLGIGLRGKPRLEPADHVLRFNLSHSGDQALFAFASGREVGIDLEAGARLGEDWPKLAQRIFSQREQAELAVLPAEQQRAGFLNGWARKEAYLKATGRGLIDGLPQIEVTLDPALPARFLSPQIAADWTLHDLRAESGVAAALVAAAGPATVIVSKVSFPG